MFHADNYGYRPGRSAIVAVRTARQRCWRADWVLDIDVKGYFDSIDWELLLRAVRRHTDCPWVLLYIDRWLKAPVQVEDGSVVPRTAGTPQGGVVSPLLANLFLHYAFDMRMARTYPHIPFERYADDIICHCKSAEEARALWGALADRFAVCKLVLHPQKTKTVYCKGCKSAWRFSEPIVRLSRSHSERGRRYGEDTSTRTVSCPQLDHKRRRPSAGRSGVGHFTITATSPCKIWLDGVILLAFIIAIPANEIVMPTALMLYMNQSRMVSLEGSVLGSILTDHGWTLLTAVCLMLYSLLHNPCGTTIWTIWRETRSEKWTLFGALMPLAIAVLVCAVVATATRLVAGVVG